MKNKGIIITIIVLLSLLVISLSTLLVLVLTSKIDLQSFQLGQEPKLLFEESYENSFEQIQVKSAAVDIQLKASNDDTTKVQIYGDKNNFKVTNHDNVLNVVSNDKSRVRFCFISCKPNRIVLWVPTDYANEIIINGNAGDIDGEDLPLANLVIDANAGDIDLGEIHSLVVKTNAGDLDIMKIASLEVRANAGDIDIGEITEYLNIRGNSEDIDIDYIDLTKDSMIELDFGDINIERIGDIYVDAQVKVGDVHINNQNRMAEHVLTIKLKSGDIEVNNRR